MMHKRSQLVSQLIIVLLSAVAILQWSAGHLVFQLFKGSPLTLNINDVAYPLALGDLPLGSVLFGFGMILVALYQELVGFRVTLFLIGQLLSGILLIWSIAVFIPQIPFLVGASDIQNTQTLLLDLSLDHLVKTTFYLFGYFIISVFYMSFRWLFKNGFYVVRYFFSFILGIISASPFIAVSQADSILDTSTLLANSLVASLHILGIFCFFLPLHYIIKWPIFIFVGSKYRESIKTHYGRKPSKTVEASSTDNHEQKIVTHSKIDDLPNPFSKEDSESLNLQKS